MDATMLSAYRFHRAWPVSAHEIGFEAQCAWAAAKAERAARDQDWVFTWTWSSEEEVAWTVTVHDQAGTLLAAIGGIGEDDEASNQWTRAWEAAVAVQALWTMTLPRTEEA